MPSEPGLLLPWCAGEIWIIEETGGFARAIRGVNEKNGNRIGRKEISKKNSKKDERPQFWRGILLGEDGGRAEFMDFL